MGMRIMESWYTDQLSYHPGPNPGFELAQLKFYSICELLQFMKGPVLMIQSGRLSMTRNDKMITGRSCCDHPIWIVSQKLETSNKNNGSLQ